MKRGRKQLCYNIGMRVPITYGRHDASLEVPDHALITSRAAAAPVPLTNPGIALLAALDQPLDYPALRRALTPDDHVVVVVDERLPRLTALLVPLLEYLVSAGVGPASITLLCLPPSTRQPWIEELPEDLEDVTCEVHDPTDRRHCSFVTTRGSKPLLFNRTAVDAAQLVVLSGRRYDPLLGYGGGAGILYPALADQSARAEAIERLTLDAPGAQPWPAHTEAGEVAWLLGAPFFVQVIEGAGDSVASIIGGAAPSLDEGQRRLDALWRHVVPRQADLVVATISGDPTRQGFADLADAVSCAVRVVKPGGKIVLLSEAGFTADEASELLRGAGDPESAVREFVRRQDIDLRSAWLWASAARQASVLLLSNMPTESVRGLFSTPIGSLAEVQQLVEQSASCLVLNDAHKTLAVVETGAQL
jgi:nickel-dependent lactate racemase